MGISARGLVVSLTDLERVVGQTLGPSRSITVTQKKVDHFAEITQDRQWIHTDVIRAADGPFGGTVVHGFLTLSLLSTILDGLLSVTDSATSINYGLNRVRFPAPLLCGSRVSGLVQIRDVHREPDRTLMTTIVTMTAQGAGRPCCVAEAITLFTALGRY